MRKNKYLFILFIFSGLLFLSALPSSSTTESEIHQFIELFVKRWNQHDPKQLSELWAENGDLINPAGEWEKGRGDVIHILAREHQGVLHNSQMRQEITNILILSPTIAWVEAKVSLNVPGVPKEDLDHHIIYLLVKQNNVWRILAARPYQFVEMHLGLMESPHAFK